MSASAYYERRAGRRSARAIEDERLLECIREVHERNYCAYGYRRMWIALRREGEGVGKGRVQRLIREAGIQGAKRRGKPWRTTKPDPLTHRRPDLVERDFSATAPNRLWVGDLTYLRSWEGVTYLAFVIDAFSRKVVGWQLASHMRTDLVLDALRNGAAVGFGRSRGWTGREATGEAMGAAAPEAGSEASMMILLSRTNGVASSRSGRNCVTTQLRAPREPKGDAEKMQASCPSTATGRRATKVVTTIFA